MLARSTKHVYARQLAEMSEMSLFMGSLGTPLGKCESEFCKEGERVRRIREKSKTEKKMVSPEVRRNEGNVENDIKMRSYRLH